MDDLYSFALVIVQLCVVEIWMQLTPQNIANNDADPMETFGLDTVGSMTLMAPGSFLNHHPRNAELFRVMLEHGADPKQPIFRPDKAFLYQNYNPDFKYWWSEWR